MFRLLNHRRLPLCQQLHYLQMAAEKLAKGFLCSPTSRTPPPRVHGAIVRFVRTAKRQSQMRQAFGMNARQFRAYVDRLLPLAREIERLAPTGASDRPNPEYPWQRDEVVVSPLSHSFPAVGWSTPAMAKFLTFLEKCLSFP